ncbi:MAG: hypothetical protein K0B05_01370 [Bacteroidales bacterium]|nr:hypothetical protein [Bacteroidales bacterium]
MANISVLESPAILGDTTKKRNREKCRVPEISVSNPVLENVRAEAGEDFYQYLHWLKLAREPNLLTLSSSHHFYYDSSDLKRVKTLINLKKLNNIKHLESFLSVVNRLLPRTAYFVGCFKNNEQNGDRLPYYSSAKFLNKLINIIDSRTDRSLTVMDVTNRLAEHNLTVIDITEINGITYFCSQNTGNSFR